MWWTHLMEEIRALGRLPQDVTGASAALGVCVSSQQLVTSMQRTLLNSPPSGRSDWALCRTRTTSGLVGSIRRWGLEPPRSKKHAHDVQQDPVPSTPVTDPTLKTHLNNSALRDTPLAERHHVWDGMPVSSCVSISRY